MTNLVLYHYWRSSSSWRVRWALALKSIDAKFIHVNLLDGESDGPEHSKRNPLGFVPVLEANGRFLIESVAILEWLEELVPSPQLYPGDAYQKAHIRSLVEIINAGIQPIQNLTVLDQYSLDPEKRKEWSRFFVRRGLKAYQERCSKTAGKFSCGDVVTAADVFLVPQLYNAERWDLPLSEFPVLEKIYKNCLETPAAMKSAPDKFKPV